MVASPFRIRIVRVRMRISVAVTDADRRALRELTRRGDVHPKARERAEAVLLYAGGWTAEQVAQHLARSERSVRRWLHDYVESGVAGLTPERPGPVPPDRTRLDEQVRALLEPPRTWTVDQLRAAVGAAGEPVSRRQMRASLGRLGARWTRTKHTLEHRQDEAGVEAAKERLETLKKGL